MIFVVGILGFVAGFIVGQMILFVILRNKKSEELLADKGLHWTYGTLNWIVAMAGMAGAMALYIYIVKGYS